jgi:hypothetical protein
MVGTRGPGRERRHHPVLGRDFDAPRGVIHERSLVSLADAVGLQCRSGERTHFDRHFGGARQASGRRALGGERTNQSFAGLERGARDWPGTVAQLRRGASSLDRQACMRRCTWTTESFSYPWRFKRLFTSCAFQI